MFTSTAEECLLFCQSEFPNCKAAMWGPTNGNTCWLKNTTLDENPSEVTN